jgi:CubicO group peptidase (beta-lactamase class C family)
MVKAPLNQIDDAVKEAISNRVMPGAVTLIARRGTIAQWEAYGYAARYTDANFTEMKHPVKMAKDTIFDLASISKLFTATAVMQLWDQGRFDLDDPVAKYIPEFAVNGKQDVTIRQLLTHTSGFRPDPPIPLYEIPGSREDKLQYVLQEPLRYPPGTHYVYSDINFMTLGVLVERLTGQREDEFVREHITEPLNMTDTMYNPPEKLKPRIAATEYQPWTDRGLVWGSVHDENAWALDGVAGHAGVFSTAHDLAVFGQMMLNGGKYKGKQVLSDQAVKLMTTNWNEAFPGQNMGLGWELAQGWYMDALAESSTFGHTGYTGTSIVISPNNKTIAILLTNRVHPTRETVSTNPIRRTVSRMAADAIPVAIPGKDGAWFSGYGSHLNRTLTAEVNFKKDAELSFETWYRTEPGYDFAVVETSSDGENWTEAARYTGSSGEWGVETYRLPENTKYIRFRYDTDTTVNGRGWYVKNVRIHSGGNTVKADLESSDWTWRNR